MFYNILYISQIIEISCISWLQNETGFVHSFTIRYLKKRPSTSPWGTLAKVGVTDGPGLEPSTPSIENLILVGGWNVLSSSVLPDLHVSGHPPSGTVLGHLRLDQPAQSVDLSLPLLLILWRLEDLGDLLAILANLAPWLTRRMQTRIQASILGMSDITSLAPDFQVGSWRCTLHYFYLASCILF